MQKIIIGIGTVLLLGILVWYGSTKATSNVVTTPPTVSSKLTATEAMFDFGTISMEKGKVIHDFAVKNETGEAITIKNISTSCMCTAATFVVGGKTYGPFGMPGHGGGSTATNVTLNPGDSGTLQAIYDPNAHGPAGVGTIDRYIYLDDTAGGQLQLEVKANVTP